MMSSRTLVFIPMYNCAKQISRVIAQFDDEMFSVVEKLVLIDNRSTDDTVAVATSALQNLPPSRYAILQNRNNYSLGGSHKVAFNYALDHGYSHVIVFHGDDQGHVKDFLRPIHAGEHEKYDCLLGSRFMKGSTITGYSLFRTVGNYVFNTLFSIATLRVITDLGSGLNMYAMQSLKARKYLKYSDTLNFNHYMLLGSIAEGDKIRFVPISWKEEDQVSNVKLSRFARLTIKILLSYIFARKALLEENHSLRADGIYEFDVIAGQES